MVGACLLSQTFFGLIFAYPMHVFIITYINYIWYVLAEAGSPLLFGLSQLFTLYINIFNSKNVRMEDYYYLPFI